MHLLNRNHTIRMNFTVPKKSQKAVGLILFLNKVQIVLMYIGIRPISTQLIFFIDNRIKGIACHGISKIKRDDAYPGILKMGIIGNIIIGFLKTKLIIV